MLQGFAAVNKRLSSGGVLTGKECGVKMSCAKAYKRTPVLHVLGERLSLSVSR